MANSETIIKEAESGDYNSCYKLGLMYLDGDSVEKSLDKAIIWMQKASESNRHYMINDYALALISRGDAEDINEAIKLLSDLSDSGNPQSIRVLGMAICKRDSEGDDLIGRALLRYAVALGNKWALYDLIMLMKFRRSIAWREYILARHQEDVWKNDFNVILAAFNAYAGNNGGKPDLDKVESMYIASVNDDTLHLSMLKSLIWSRNSVFAPLLKNDSSISKQDFAVEFAKMYRDGIIFEKSGLMYKKTISGLDDRHKNILNNN